MGNPFSKVAAGDDLSIPAKAWNTLMDVATAYNGSGVKSGSVGLSALGGSRPTVLVRNDSGAGQNALAVMGITGLAITQADNDDEFKAKSILAVGTPTTANHAGKFVVLSEPIANGEIGRAYITGVFPVQINMRVVGDKFADVSNGDATRLTSGASGAAQILWAATGTGTQWALVRMGNAIVADQPVKITSVAADKGKYGGVFLSGATGSTAGDLTIGQVGTAGDVCIVWNLSEITDSTSPRLGVGDVVIGTILQHAIADTSTDTIVGVHSAGPNTLKGDEVWIDARDNQELADTEDEDANTGLAYKFFHLPSPASGSDPGTRTMLVTGNIVDVANNVFRTWNQPFDSMGHLSGTGSLGDTKTLLQAGDAWIAVAPDAGGIKVSHADGDRAQATSGPSAGSIALQQVTIQYDVTSGLLVCRNKRYGVDVHGHVLGEDTVSLVDQEVPVNNPINIITSITYDAATKTLKYTSQLGQFIGKVGTETTTTVLTATPCAGT